MAIKSLKVRVKGILRVSIIPPQHGCNGPTGTSGY